MALIAVINQKGGVGKTTIAGLLGLGLGASLLDCDPQESLKDWLGERVVTLAFDDPRQWIKSVKAVSGLVILDCPPGVGPINQAALMACDLALIPCGPSPSDILATGKILSLVNVAKGLRAGSPDAWIVPSRVDFRTTGGKTLSDDLAAFGVPVAPSIGYRTAYIEAMNTGGSISGGTKASEEIDELINEVKKWLRKQAKQATKAP